MKKVSLGTVIGLLVALALVGVALGQGLPGSGWWSGEQIQNVGSSQATINVTAYETGGPTTYNASANVDPGASITFIPSDFPGMPDGFMGSAVVSSDQPIRAIVNVTNREAGSFGTPGGLAAAQYQGMNAGDTTIFFPLAKNDYFNKTTTFYIQNAGSSDATADATFTLGGSTYNYTTPMISPGQMVVVTPDDAGAPSGDTDGLGSLVVTSAQPLAGSVLEHFTSENPATLVQATRAFSSGDADTTAYAPIIKDNWFDRFTGLQIQNADSGDVDVTVTYAGVVAGCDATDTFNGLGPGESVTFVHGFGSNLPADCLASATVEATGNIVAIVNESFTPAAVSAGAQQASTTYSAQPDNATTTEVSLPLEKENWFSKGTGIQVQNVGAAQATNVVLTYTDSGGTSYTTNPQTIDAGSSQTFFNVRKNSGLWSGTAMPDVDGLYAVTVTADQPVVAIANETGVAADGTTPSTAFDKNNYEGFNLVP